MITSTPSSFQPPCILNSTFPTPCLLLCYFDNPLSLIIAVYMYIGEVSWRQVEHGQPTSDHTHKEELFYLPLVAANSSSVRGGALIYARVLAGLSLCG